MRLESQISEKQQVVWCPHDDLRKKIPRLGHLSEIQSLQRLWGRAGGIRLATKNTDLLVLTRYFPLKTQEGAKAETRYRRTTQDLIDWASGVISEAPHRTLQVIGLDLNDGLGLCQARGKGQWRSGRDGRLEEGWAGRRFRLMLEEQSFTSPAATHTRRSPTTVHRDSRSSSYHGHPYTQVEGHYSMRR